MKSWKFSSFREQVQSEDLLKEMLSCEGWDNDCPTGSALRWDLAGGQELPMIDVGRVLLSQWVLVGEDETFFVKSGLVCAVLFRSRTDHYLDVATRDGYVRFYPDGEKEDLKDRPFSCSVPEGPWILNPEMCQIGG